MISPSGNSTTTSFAACTTWAAVRICVGLIKTPDPIPPTLTAVISEDRSEYSVCDV